MQYKFLDGAKRAARTFVQGALGVFFLTYIGPLYNLLQDIVEGGGDNIVIDLNFWRNALLACVAGGAIALVSLGQNWLEDGTSFPTLLKSEDRKLGDAQLGESTN